MVKHENFKTCDQSGFCKRNRAYADLAAVEGSKWVSPYRLDSSSVQIKDGAIKGTVLKSVDESGTTVELPIIISFLKSGVVRVQMDEAKRQKGDIELRHDSKARKERYNEAAKWSVVGSLDRATVDWADGHGSTFVRFGPDDSYQATIHHSPFSIDFIRDDKVHVQLNAQGLLNFEHWRPKVEKVKEEPKEGEEAKSEEASKDATPEGPDESTWWEETFGGNTDSKPRGPESIGLDITFPGYEHVFGIPEHTGPLSLKETR
jgi:alpha 1,3-glucosidase